MNKLKEKISEVISTHISLDDTYTYELTRVKSAFEVGTISLEDFEEWSEKNVDDLAEAIVCALQPQLNDNQKIVLEWLKSNRNSLKVPMLAFYELAELADENTNLAYHQLDSKQEIEVLAAFAQWGLGQEEAE